MRYLLILHKDKLTTDHDVSAALDELAAFAHRGNVEGISTHLMGTQHLLPFVVSRMSSFASHILEAFPATAKHYLSSAYPKLIEELSLYLYFLPYDFSREDSEYFKECRRFLQLFSRGLHTLAACSYPLEDELAGEFDNELDESDSWIQPVQRATRRAQNRDRKTASIDYKVFEELGLGMPATLEDATELGSTLLKQVKSILQFYLDTLRQPCFIDAISGSYLPSKDVHTPETALDVPLTPTAATATSQPASDTEEKSSAYPKVLPVKAALHFDSADGFGDWRVLVSNRASKNLREARREDAQKFKIIIKKIKQLSKGHFSNDNQKRLNSHQAQVPIYEAKMTRDLRLIYQIDCIPYYDRNFEQQVIKVYGIYTHAQLDKRLWESVGMQLERHGTEYRRRCIFRNPTINAGDNVFSPATFPPQEQSSPDGSKEYLKLPPEYLDDLHSLLVLEKYVTFSQALLNSMIANQDLAHVFVMSPREQEIVEHVGSSYVIGRSGTGKTTTMLFKMLGLERAHALSKDRSPKPRQIFVTQSSVLAEKVEEYFTNLLKSLATASLSLKDLAKLAKSQSNKEGVSLIDRDDDNNWRSDLPRRFSELEDHHFPLFITFDRLCHLLEADMQPQPKHLKWYDLDGHDKSSSSARPAGQELTVPSRTLLTYRAFLEFYWPHFPQATVKRLDPSLVYSEIMGVIKGSEFSLAAPQGFLEQNEYEQTSVRSQSTFATKRDIIYDIFRRYQKQKAERWEYDIAERSCSLIKQIQESGVQRKIDYLYVDEVQDNLLIDALLLRSLCRNEGGLFWAGDTAQTISVGSSFKFNELKAFLHRVEKKNCSTTGAHLVEPPTFYLTQNYRSHSGIVNCAHSVVELISRFWPNAIDSLPRENGVVDGPRPVLLGGCDQNSVRYEQFLFGNAGSHIEFGAQQCILVRDDAAREQLKSQVGDIGLIMTLYESKGLEFNDVLLYNFFQDSPVSYAQWRLVLNGVESAIKGPEVISAPRFDEVSHAGICTELKFLYVAITRARKNMWIADCSEKSEPMRAYWTSRELVHNCLSGMDVPHLAVSSTTEEWCNSGTTLFLHKRYVQAKHCFERASMHREAAVANAYDLRDRSNNSEAFSRTARAFETCAREAERWREKMAYFRTSAECYEKAGEYLRAAERFLDAKEYDHSAILYRRVGMFDHAVEVVKTHRQHVDDAVASSIMTVARLYYFNTAHDLEKACSLFPCVQDALEFTEDYDLDVAQASLLETMGKTADAAELHFQEGRILDAIRLFSADTEVASSMVRAHQCLVSAISEKLSFGVMPEDGDTRPASELQQLFHLSRGLNYKLLHPSAADEIAVYEAVMEKNVVRLAQLAKLFQNMHNDNLTALYCLDVLFISPPQILGVGIHEASTQLRMFYDYVTLLREITLLPNPCDNPDIGKLFGFQIHKDRVFLVRKSSFLYPFIASSRISIIRSNEHGFYVSSDALSRAYVACLRHFHRDKVMAENEFCKRAVTRSFSPCLAFAVDGHCNRVGLGCPQQHISREDITPDWFNARVRLHIQQILILQSLHGVDIGASRLEEQRFWLSNLYDAVYPPLQILGTSANMLLMTMPEAPIFLKTVSQWVESVLYTTTTPTTKVSVSTLAKVANISFLFEADSDPRFSLYNSPYVKSPALDPRLIRPQGGYIIKELIHFIDGSERRSVLQGILSIQQIINTKIPIEVPVLCDILEHICGSIVLSYRLRNTNSLHGVTLPFSWLISLRRKFQAGSFKDPARRLWGTFVDFIMVLILQMRVQRPWTAHLLFGQASFFSLGLKIRSTFIQRCCRCLYLLGYNIQDDCLRNAIVSAMKILGKDDSIANNTIYRLYATARSWRDLAYAVRQPIPGQRFDEMICVQWESRVANSMKGPPGVRFLPLKNLQDIPTQFDVKRLRTTLSSLRPDASSFIPSLLSASTESPGQPMDQEAPADSTHDEDEDVLVLELDENNDPDSEPVTDHSTAAIAEDSDSKSDSGSILADVESMAPPIISEEHVRSAQIIQVAYRTYQRKKRQATSSGLSEARKTYFALCYEQSLNITWSSRQYKLCYLGPLSHGLVCVQEIEARLYPLKAKAKRRLAKAEHEELEKVGERMTVICTLMKDIKKLQRLLEPKSELHCRQEKKGLKSSILEVDSVLRRSAPLLGDVSDLQKEIDVAIKGIVKDKHVKPKQKPTLNVEDVLY